MNLRRIYKMTLREFFKRLGINLEEEIEETSTETVEQNVEENKNNVVESTNKTTEKKVEPVVEEKKQEVKKMAKYNAKTGLWDYSDVEDAELKAQYKLANDTIRAKANAELINKAIDEKMSSVKLIAGISSDFVKNALDRTGIKVTDGQVTGVEEAFNNLKTAQSGLFVADKQTKSNPTLEGFNPKNVGEINYANMSITEAHRLDQGI